MLSWQLWQPSRTDLCGHLCTVIATHAHFGERPRSADQTQAGHPRSDPQLTARRPPGRQPPVPRLGDLLRGRRARVLPGRHRQAHAPVLWGVPGRGAVLPRHALAAGERPTASLAHHQRSGCDTLHSTELKLCSRACSPDACVCRTASSYPWTAQRRPTRRTALRSTGTQGTAPTASPSTTQRWRPSSCPCRALLGPLTWALAVQECRLFSGGLEAGRLCLLETHVLQLTVEVLLQVTSCILQQPGTIRRHHQVQPSSGLACCWLADNGWLCSRPRAVLRGHPGDLLLCRGPVRHEPGLGCGDVSQVSDQGAHRCCQAASNSLGACKQSCCAHPYH